MSGCYLFPGSAYVKTFTISSSSGPAIDADSLPTAVASRNGTDDAGFVLTVAKVDTGRYKVTGTIPITYSENDSIEIIATASIGGVTGFKGVIHFFKIVTATKGTAGTYLDTAVSQVFGTVQGYYPTAATRDIGSDQGGTLSDLQTHNEVYFVTGENNASGIQNTFNRTTADAVEIALRPSNVRITGFYDSNNNAHLINVYAYNYTNSTYELIGIMPASTFAKTYVFPMSADNHDAVTGTMSIRLVHNSVTYDASHRLRIDAIEWRKTSASNMITTDLADILSRLPNDVPGAAQGLPRVLDLPSGVTAEEVDQQLSATHGSGPWGSGVTGVYSTVITVTDGTDPLPDVAAAVYNSNETALLTAKRTDALGQITVLLDAGTYKVRLAKAGYAFNVETLTVAADGTATFSGTVVSNPVTPATGLQVLRGYITLASFVPISGQEVRVEITDKNINVDNTYITKQTTLATTDANGYFELLVAKGLTIRIFCKYGYEIFIDREITITDDDSRYLSEY